MRAIIFAAITVTVLTAAAARADDLPTLGEPYRLMTLPGNPATFLVVDTKTARFWQLEKRGDKLVFLPVPYLYSERDDLGTDRPPEPKR